MTVTRQHVTVAAVCGGIGYLGGLSVGVLIAGWTPDVVTAAIAILVLGVWTGVALFVGALIQRRGEAERLDLALALRRQGEQVRLAEALAAQRAQFEAQLAADEDALIEATKEDR